MNTHFSISIKTDEYDKVTLFLGPDPASSGNEKPQRVETRVVPMMTSRIQPGMSVAI
jgi:hypothetical protein